MISRRAVLLGGGAAGIGAAALVGWEVAPESVRFRVRQTLGVLPDPYIPDVPEGEVRLESVTSQHLGEIDLFTAVPDGYGDGAGAASPPPPPPPPPTSRTSVSRAS
jgi:hypothetical protein